MSTNEQQTFCPLCRTLKPIEQFPKGGNLNQKHSWCKICTQIYHKGYRAGVQSLKTTTKPLEKSLILTNRLIEFLKQHKDKLVQFQAEVIEQEK